MNKKQELRQELTHLEGYYRDRKRLAFKLKNGMWNMKPLTKEETETIEKRIKELKEMLNIE